jgi:hypothetical protein
MTMDPRSKGILKAWILSDILWALAFIFARRRDEKRTRDAA